MGAIQPKDPKGPGIIHQFLSTFHLDLFRWPALCEALRSKPFRQTAIEDALAGDRDVGGMQAATTSGSTDRNAKENMERFEPSLL